MPEKKTRRKRKPRWNVSNGMARFDTKGEGFKLGAKMQPKREKETKHGKLK